MKSMGVTLKRTYLTKNCIKKDIVRHLTKLFNILDIKKLNYITSHQSKFQKLRISVDNEHQLILK